MSNVYVCCPQTPGDVFCLLVCVYFPVYIAENIVNYARTHCCCCYLAVFCPLFCFIFGRATYIDRKRSAASAVLLTLLDATGGKARRRRSCSGCKVNFPVGRRDRKVRARRRHRGPVSTRKCRNSAALSSSAATRYAFRAAQTFMTRCSHGKRLQTSLLRVR